MKEQEQRDTERPDGARDTLAGMDPMTEVDRGRRDPILPPDPHERYLNVLCNGSG